jgi:hypothetical protein
LVAIYFFKFTLPQGKPICQGRAMKALHLKSCPKTISRPFIELPTKENGRPGFHESAILLPRQGKAGTTLPSCLAPSGLPCLALFQARPWKTTN